MNEQISDKYAKIYKGSNILKVKSKKKTKVVAFDLDETLGSFVDLDILWKLIHQFKPTNNSYSSPDGPDHNRGTSVREANIRPPPNNIDFNNLLDLYPEFIRYGIISILEYLKQKKNNRRM